MRPPPGLSQDTSEFEQQYLHHAEDDDHQIDFSSVLGQPTHHESALIDEQPPPQPQQLQQPDQQTSNLQVSHPHNQAAIPSASDTATAALAQYHTMSVPQPTENTFMHQPTEGGDRISATPADQTPVQRSGSFGDMEVSGPNGDASSPSGAQATPGGSKPSVGSEEWHKVRRDNHKEGKNNLAWQYRSDADTHHQSNVAAERPLMKASTRLRKLCRAAKRTRVASSRVPSSSSRSSKTTKPRTSRNGRWRSCLPSKPSQNSPAAVTSLRTIVSAPGPSASSGRRRRRKRALHPSKGRSQLQARSPSRFQCS
jgi:hypothetical protein